MPSAIAVASVITAGPRPIASDNDAGVMLNLGVIGQGIQKAFFGFLAIVLKQSLKVLVIRLLPTFAADLKCALYWQCRKAQNRSWRLEPRHFIFCKRWRSSNRLGVRPRSGHGQFPLGAEATSSSRQTATSFGASIPRRI